MARNGADVLRKKNTKLEAFLERQLDAETFERVRAHDACIVCSEKEDKAFKFVVLSDEWIYLTENPPKKVQEAVHFKDVSAIDLVNEFPDFLSGEERENTMHIVVKYATDEPKGKRRGSKTPREGNKSPRSETSRSSPLPSSSREKKRQSLKGSPTHSSRSLDSGVSKKEISSLTVPDSNITHRRSNSLKVGKKEKKSESKRRNSFTGKEHLLQGNDTIDEDNISEHSYASNLASTLRNRYSSSEYEHKKERPRPLPNPSEEFDENGDYIDKRTKEPFRYGFSNSGELKLNLDGLTGSGSEDENDSARNSEPNSDEVFDGEGIQPKRETHLDLYIMYYSSPILMLARSAWHNYLIRGTRDQGLEYSEHEIIAPKKSGLNDRLDRLFGQLKTEILDPNNAMEDVFHLVNELKTGAEKNFALKKLFWKTPELFSFIVKQLQWYLPKSPVRMNTHSDEEKQRRADEFELITLLLEVLYLMFRETEILSNRLQSLKTKQGKVVLDLMVVLTCFPEIPIKYVPPSKKAAMLMNSTQADQWKCLADIELSKLLQEFTNKSTAVFSELILIAHQANWGDSTGNFLNITWMMKILEELNTTEKFVETIVSQAMRLICPSKREELLPEEAVLVFQQFSVLQTLITYSPRIVTFMRNNFHEEFKYYIQAPIILRKLPRSYPIAAHTIRLIEETMGAVLQKKVDLSHGQSAF